MPVHMARRFFPQPIKHRVRVAQEFRIELCQFEPVGQRRGLIAKIQL
jgi:hypothetical protein